MHKTIKTLLISFIATTFASAGATGMAGYSGAGHELLLIGSGTCTGGEECTRPHGDPTCDVDTLGVVYRNVWALGENTFGYQDMQCAWGDSGRFVVDTYTVTRGGEDLACPIVASGPFTTATNVWPPYRYTGLTTEQLVYCKDPR